MATEEQKVVHLNEHLPYELQMLRHTFIRLYAAQDILDWNAFLESFGIHARILKEFITNDSGSGNLEARDYIPTFQHRLPSELTGAFQRIGPQITHLANRRPSDSGSKFTRERAKEVYDWIEPLMCNFVSQLGAEYRPHWNESVASSKSVPSSLHLGVTVQSATNSITHTGTMQSTTLSRFLK